MNTKFNNILTDDRQELKDYIKGLAALSRKLKVVRRETPNRRMTPKEHEEIGRWILIYDDMWNIDRCLHYLSKILRCLYKKQAELRGKPEPEQNVRTEKKWGKDSFHYAWENCLNHYEVYYNHKEKMKQELEHKEHLQKLGYQDNGKLYVLVDSNLRGNGLKAAQAAHATIGFVSGECNYIHNHKENTCRTLWNNNTIVILTTPDIHSDIEKLKTPKLRSMYIWEEPDFDNAPTAVSFYGKLPWFEQRRLL